MPLRDGPFRRNVRPRGPNDACCWRADPPSAHNEASGGPLATELGVRQQALSHLAPDGVMSSRSLIVGPRSGYSPIIGQLVCMLDYARATTLAAVAGLDIAALDAQRDAKSNSIGALLAHIAVVERGYQVLTFDERVPSPTEKAS